MTMKQGLLGLLAGILLGAWLGHTQWLCWNGHCPLTGTWLGGAILGGLVGFLLAARPPLAAATPVPVPIPVRRPRTPLR
jgi:hypothetical protein